MQSLSFFVGGRSSAGDSYDPFSNGLTLDVVRQALTAVLELDDDGADVSVTANRSQDGSALGFCVLVSGIGLQYMNRLRDQLLSGDVDVTLSRALEPQQRFSLHTDLSAFAEQYEESVLALNSLTPHQQEKLAQCAGSQGAHAHLKAPAGAGKTYVALHRVLDLLQSHPSEYSLFVAQNDALAYMAASWIGKRVRGRDMQRQLLSRMHMLHEPFEQGVQRVAIRNNRVWLEPLDSPMSGESRIEYALVVVDEAHHVYSRPSDRSIVEAYVTAGKSQRLLLSDISQSLGRDIAYPAECREVVLSEVVRCSKRIVAGAMAFQLGGEEKLLTKCHHEATGPPLKSYLFDMPGAESDTCIFETYADYTIRALDHVVTTFPGLNLHNRLAIIVPDAAFLEHFRPKLATALTNRFPDRPICVVDAAAASADLGVCSDASSTEEASVHEDNCQQHVGEWLVCDSIRKMDGLERLIVVGVGLDSIISSNCENANETSGQADLETRSMLYRAVTRAHLLAIVVNEFLRGGWLEFLGSVRLRDDEAFNSAIELKRAEVSAVDGVIMTELAACVAAGAESRSLNLSDDALSAIVAEVAKLREKGKALDVSVKHAIDVWHQALEQVQSVMQSVAVKLDLSQMDAAKAQELASFVTLGVYRGEVASLSLAVTEVLNKHKRSDLDMRVKIALERASMSGEGDVGREVLAKLRPRVLIAVERGESLEAAAVAAIAEWYQIEAQVDSVLQAELVKKELTVTADIQASLRSSVISSVCGGEALQTAAETVVSKYEKDKAETDIVTALELAFVQTCRTVPVICAGSRVRLFGLAKNPSYNDKEGTAKRFAVAAGRWDVLLDGQRKLVAIRPANMSLLDVAAEKQQLQQQVSRKETIQVLKAAVSKALVEGETLDAASTKAATDWRIREAQVISGLESAAVARQLFLDNEATCNLVHSVLASFWEAESENEDEGSGSGFLEDRITSVLTNWAQREHAKQAEDAEITSALEAEAHSQRILVTDAAMATLHRRVQAALRSGDDLVVAVTAALNEWRKQLVSKQISQTVWDPSGNETRKVTGVVRFMPFKHNIADHLFEYSILVCVFPMLPFRELGAFSRVCKRWRNIAFDPSWKPNLVAYAWGDSDVTGLSMRCTHPTFLDFALSKQIHRIVCADTATFALTGSGEVWFWGKSWIDVQPDCPEPTRLEELQDIVSVAVTPAGYYHGRGRRPGFSCAAVTRGGSLYTWGFNSCQQLFHPELFIERPKLVNIASDSWHPETERVLSVGCGLDYLAMSVQRAETGVTSVLSCGSFTRERRQHRAPEVREWQELRGVKLRQLVTGAFHCCALTTRGDLYTFGDESGLDGSNGNLLGHGPVSMQRTLLDAENPPRIVVAEGLGPIAEVSCTTYITIAITVDGRVFTWGDRDGDALGHTSHPCNNPTLLPTLRWQRVSHGSSSYTNAAVATDEGRVFMWGGNSWEGGIAADRDTTGPSEVKWNGVPSCYSCSSVALAHRHGYLIFRKRP